MVIAINLLLVQGLLADTPAQPIEPNKNVNVMQEKINKLKSQTIAVGKITKNEEGFMMKDVILPTYHCMNVSYIAVSDLRQIGGNIV